VTDEPEVTEKELAQAREWLVKELSKTYNMSNDRASIALQEWQRYFALYARQEREAERGRIADEVMPEEMCEELRDDLATREGVEERWFDLAAIYCPYCKIDGWPNFDEHGRPRHLTPDIFCKAGIIWLLRGDTKTLQKIELADRIRKGEYQ
jgi:hypothetical protein